MRKYEPEILMGLILCLALVLVHPPGGISSTTEQPECTATASAGTDRRNASFDRSHTLRILQGNTVRMVSMREYLIGVMMSEMPMSFAPEAIKAQAIASRTYALHCQKHSDADVCSDGGCCQRRADENELRERFGAEYEALRQKARQAVDSTDGTVLTYDGALIDATYFACSGGMTEDALEVWGTQVPYLCPVSSPGEENARSFYSQVGFGPEEFASAILAMNPDAQLETDPAEWLGPETRTAGDGVRTLEVGGTVLTGVQLRSAFSLSSTNFTLRWDGAHFCFDVYGAGHRVGMSQYGAQAMALEGATAEQILKTYYTGVEISHI